MWVSANAALPVALILWETQGSESSLPQPLASKPGQGLFVNQPFTGSYL